MPFQRTFSHHDLIRICPGKHLAENSIFVYVSNILANFTIAPPSPEVKKDNGIPTPQDATFDNGIVRSGALEKFLPIINLTDRGNLQ